MPETSGVIAKAGKNNYGHFFQLDGDKTFYNESKKSIESKMPWPQVNVGDQVRVEYWESDTGKRYVMGNELHVTAAPTGKIDPYSETPQLGNFAYKERS